MLLAALGMAGALCLLQSLWFCHSDVHMWGRAWKSLCLLFYQDVLSVIRSGCIFLQVLTLSACVSSPQCLPSLQASSGETDLASYSVKFPVPGLNSRC